MEVLLNFLKKEYADKAKAHYMSGHETIFQTLVSCVLSQRTKDEITEKAGKKLFSKFPDPKSLARANAIEVEKLIYPVGFYKQKAGKIIRLARNILEEHEGRVPHDRNALINLPGVGPKTADVTLCYGFGDPVIPVDVHVRVVAKRLGLVSRKASYEEVRRTLEILTSKKDRWLVNVGLVMFGREVCRTRNPSCNKCKIKSICDYYNKTGEWKK